VITNKKVMFRIGVSLVALLSTVTIALVMYCVGYWRGSIDAEIKRIPFDLEIYLQLHEMGTYINSSDDSVPVPVVRKDNARVLMYGTLQLYDRTRGRFEKISTRGLRFDDNLARAREAVRDLELVSVESVLRDAGIIGGNRGQEHPTRLRSNR